MTNSEKPDDLPDLSNFSFNNDTSGDSDAADPDGFLDEELPVAAVDDTAEEPYVPPVLVPEASMFPVGPSLEGGTGNDAPYYSTKYSDIPDELREDVTDWQPAPAKKEPRRYGLFASILIVLALVLIVPMAMWIPQVVATHNAEQAISAELDKTPVVWSDYDAAIKAGIVSAINDKNCQGLQKQFDAVVARNYELKKPSGKTSPDLLKLVDKKLTELGCYGSQSTGAVTPAPTASK